MGSTHGIGVKRSDYHRRNRRRNISMHKHSHGHNVGVGHLERIANTKIEIPALDREVLVNRAVRHWNKIHAVIPDTPVSLSALDRICVDYIRHQLSPYDKLTKRVGSYSDGYKLILEKVYDAIADAYPWLAEECRLQKTVRANTSVKVGGVRLVKGGSLTSAHIEELNEREEKTFSGVCEDEEESGPLYGYDGALSSLDSERMLYFPPFLKRDEIAARRFGNPEQMNDHWWEWEREQKLKTVTGRPRGTNVETE